MTKPKACIVDLDNCLALIGDRDPYAGHRCASDTLCEATALVVNALYWGVDDLTIIILTGRNETARRATEDWLDGNELMFSDLLMRSPDDWRDAAEYKAAMLDEKILPEYDVVLALDDDPDVIAAYRSRGIVAWQVREPLPERVTSAKETV